MSIVVYYLHRETRVPDRVEFSSTELTQALAEAESRRKAGYVHVSISSELDECVTKPGVDSIVDGKTPDGHEYGWRKRRP